MGIADGYDTDAARDFLVTHSITFTTLSDTPDLFVTSHYDIGYWSEFWLLDTYGNRTGTRPLPFETELVEQLLPDTAPHQPSPTTWDLGYLADR